MTPELPNPQDLASVLVKDPEFVRDPCPAAPCGECPEIIGSSRSMLAVVQFIAIAAKADYPVLIEGESGTGKEVVARAIHRLSARSAKPFLSENCGALPENLVESECFGHERGAFTGATCKKAGLFERACGGTVFLDEIGEMALSTQRKLLRVLQEKQIRRVGGQQLLPVDFRVVSATNRVLEEMVASGAFRKDLFYRLNVATISLPPLRERTEDIPLLIDSFKVLFAAELGKAPMEFTDRALAALATYPWPGNVRELRNEVLRLAFAGKRRVDSDALSRRILNLSVYSHPPESDRKNGSRPLFEVERDALGAAIIAAIRSANGNRSEAARRLGITRSSLYRRLERYRLLLPPEALLDLPVERGLQAPPARPPCGGSSPSPDG